MRNNSHAPGCRCLRPGQNLGSDRNYEVRLGFHNRFHFEHNFASDDHRVTEMFRVRFRIPNRPICL